MQQLGKIITFYSYKGGTGRTMALANLAWVLASNDKHVLLVDWDLEAPGLHRYLKPFLVDPDLRDTPGLIDFIWDLAKDKVTPTSTSEEIAPSTLTNDFAKIEDYVVGLVGGAEGGSISFIPAGRQDENYARRVNSFDWDNFYERLGGGKLLQAVREDIRSTYDYVLIDSRTGVSDTSGICTVQLPDLLVVCFTLNRQSVKGAAAVAGSIAAQRGPAFKIYPVPTRLENAETDKLKSARRFSRSAFKELLLHVQSDQKILHFDQQAPYWNAVETPYTPFYAFEEVPAAFKDPPGAYGTILASTERLAHWITAGDVSALRTVKEDWRERIVAAYAFSEEELGSGPSSQDPPKDGRSSMIRRLINSLPCRTWTDLLRTGIALIILSQTAYILYNSIGTASLHQQLMGVQTQLKDAQKNLTDAQKNSDDSQKVLAVTQKLLAAAQQRQFSPAPTAAVGNFANNAFIVYPHYRPDNRVSVGFLDTVKKQLADAGFQVSAQSKETKNIVADKPTLGVEGPHVDYFANTAKDAAERVASILNAKLPKEFGSFIVKREQYSGQDNFIGVWF